MTVLQSASTFSAEDPQSLAVADTSTDALRVLPGVSFIVSPLIYVHSDYAAKKENLQPLYLLRDAHREDSLEGWIGKNVMRRRADHRRFERG